MKTLSSALLTELGLTVTRPGYFVQIDFTTPLYLSSLGTVSWGGYTWTAADIRVKGLQHTESGQQTGNIILGNAWMDYGAIVLNEGVGDRPIKVWAVWAGVVEPILEFSGVGDDVEIGLDVNISLTSQGSSTLYSPRRFINSASGFTTLLPKGTKIKIGQQTYILER